MHSMDMLKQIITKNIKSIKFQIWTNYLNIASFIVYLFVKYTQ